MNKNIIGFFGFSTISTVFMGGIYLSTILNHNGYVFFSAVLFINSALFVGVSVSSFTDWLTK